MTEIIKTFLMIIGLLTLVNFIADHLFNLNEKVLAIKLILEEKQEKRFEEILEEHNKTKPIFQKKFKIISTYGRSFVVPKDFKNS